MAVESAADRAAFVNSDEFGASATYTLAAGGATTVVGVLVKEFAEGEGKNAGLSVPVQAFRCRTADLPAGAKAGDRLAIASASLNFRVVAVQPDHAGMAVIVLG